MSNRRATAAGTAGESTAEAATCRSRAEPIRSKTAANAASSAAKTSRSDAESNSIKPANASATTAILDEYAAKS